MTRIYELSETIRNHLDSNADYNLSLEKQIKDLQIQIQLSQRQKRNTDAIIYSIRDAVIVIDEFDRLLMANEAAGRVFGFDFKTSQHRPISELIDINKNEKDSSAAPSATLRAKGLFGMTEFVDFLRQSRESKVRATRREIKIATEIADCRLPIDDCKSKIENRKPKIENQQRTFDCIVSCVYDETEQVCGAVAVLHDITREKEKREMKNDFVSAVCHELKTPLASITAYSEMLIDGEAEDEQTRKEFYSVIQSQAKRLNRLIEDILNTSRIESGLIKVEKRPVSLAILIEEQLQMIKGQAQEKNIEIIGQKPIVFDQVYADKDMMSQVIVNLLSNAVKYTRPGGSIKIGTEVDEIANLARVGITDTGVGIGENELKHVFDKFYRVSDNPNKSQAKGTGLGLNLVKQIVEKVHAGRVFATSKPGVGSTFGFELPLAVAEAIKN